MSLLPHLLHHAQHAKGSDAKIAGVALIFFGIFLTPMLIGIPIIFYGIKKLND